MCSQMMGQRSAAGRSRAPPSQVPRDAGFCMHAYLHGFPVAPLGGSSRGGAGAVRLLLRTPVPVSGCACPWHTGSTVKWQGRGKRWRTSSVIRGDPSVPAPPQASNHSAGISPGRGGCDPHSPFESRPGVPRLHLLVVPPDRSNPFSTNAAATFIRSVVAASSPCCPPSFRLPAWSRRIQIRNQAPAWSDPAVLEHVHVCAAARMRLGTRTSFPGMPAARLSRCA